jgi:hypothetical protein
VHRSRCEHSNRYALEIYAGVTALEIDATRERYQGKGATIGAGYFE